MENIEINRISNNGHKSKRDILDFREKDLQDLNRSTVIKDYIHFILRIRYIFLFSYMPMQICSSSLDFHWIKMNTQ